MQLWKVSAGLTTAGAGLALLLLGSRREYLAPFWQVILFNYGRDYRSTPGVRSGDCRGHPLWGGVERVTLISPKPCIVMPPASGTNDKIATASPRGVPPCGLAWRVGRER